MTITREQLHVGGVYVRSTGDATVKYIGETSLFYEQGGNEGFIEIKGFLESSFMKPATRPAWVNLWWNGRGVTVGVDHPSKSAAEEGARVKGGFSGDTHLATIELEIPNT